MIPEALLVSPSEISVKALKPVLENLGTRIERERDALVALTRLNQRRYDALIVDCEGGGDEAEVIREVHEAGIDRHTITIAVIGEKEDANLAYAMGAHFVLRKPLTTGRVERMMRAAHALVQERRTHQRFACEGPVTVWSGELRVNGELLDLSAGGAALQCESSDRLERAVRMRFALPGTSTFIRPEAEVAWQNRFGRAGLRFTRLSDLDSEALESWLAHQRATAPPMPR